jgi:uncharacterized protein YndB with AHSA1/START domain
MTQSSASPLNDDATFRISRTVGGSLDAVWRAYTEQEPLMQRFGPSGFSMPFSRFDLRPGGEFHYCLRTPTGFEMWGKWTFLEIDAPHLLSMLVTFSDADEIPALKAGHASMALGCNASFEQHDANLAELPRP